jgi:hypothetical protein
MALSGLGDIRFDDLQIIPLDASSPGSGPSGVPVKSPKGAAPWDFLRRLPGFGGKADAN